jgi:pimeloyl-ACP methyl ester carboxylesterase
MADDTAALLTHLGVGSADIVGYSMGGGVALQLAIRHPAVVRKLVVASASYTSDGMRSSGNDEFWSSAGRRPGWGPCRGDAAHAGGAD